MNRLLLLIFPLSFLLLSNSPKPVETIKWLSIEEALELNKKNPKGIFIDVYTDWCGWCKKMDATTFVNPQVTELMNKHFYAVKFNSETYKNKLEFNGQEFNFNPSMGRRGVHEFAVSILQGKLSYPSYAFLDEKLNLVTVVPGYRESKEFKGMLIYLGEKRYEKQSYQDFVAEYEAGN